MDIKQLQKEIVKRLKPLKPEKIILFGSYAYGKPSKESDVDICVIEKDYKNKFENKKRIYEALSDLDISFDILNPKKEEYEFYKNEYGSVYKDIEEKGIVLWNS